MTEQELRGAVVVRAKAWLGRKEADGSHQEIIDVYNQIRPLPRGYRMTYKDPWCAAFVSAVGAALGLTATILPECACDPMIALYKASGRWATTDRITMIQPGDLIFYDWDQNGSADHVGIIVDITASGYRVIEGNISDAVGYRTVARNYNLIRGFCLPDYAAAARDEGSDEVIVVEPEPEPDAPVFDPDTPNGDSFELRFRNLRLGCVGEDVRALQRNLKSLGFDVGRHGLDGELGSDTLQAVKAYQRSVRLDPDGEVGPRTMAALMGVN